MKVLIVNNMMPFCWGGAEELAVNLKKHLIMAGHRSEILRIPFHWNPASVIPSQMLMVRNFELQNVDRVIALKFPAYLIRHPHKTLWLLHQYRQAYDLFNTQFGMTANEMNHEVKKIIENADNQSFKEFKAIFTISKITQERLNTYNQVKAQILTPPLNDESLYTGGESKKYIFAGGRINKMKRQLLLIESMASAASEVQLIIAGPPDSPEDAEALVKRVEALNLKDRVKLDLRFLLREELVNYVNHSLACVYVPYNEDWGYVAAEACAAGKALVTTTDSGGVLDFVIQRQTGWICEPNPQAIAEVLSEASLNPKQTQAYGISAREAWSAKRTQWPQVIERLIK